MEKDNVFIINNYLTMEKQIKSFGKCLENEFKEWDRDCSPPKSKEIPSIHSAKNGYRLYCRPEPTVMND